MPVAPRGGEAAVEAPEPREIKPVLPELVVPELKDSDPLPPFLPAFDVRIEIAPLLLAIPCAVCTLTVPPVNTVL